MYILKLDDIVTEYKNVNHSTMISVDVKSRIYVIFHAGKSNLKCATDLDTSRYAKKADLATLK